METVSLLRFILSFAVILGLIGLFALALKRWPALRGMGSTMGGSQRLKVVEQRAIDVRNKLVLVQRDGTQHLLLVGNDHAMVVENDIPLVIGEVKDA